MPDKKISDLVDGGDLQGTDELVVARAGDNFKISGSKVASNQVAVTLDGNTAGALALVNTGTLTLAGGNNITVSQAGNAITISGANAGGAQTGISGIANSEATYTSGTVELVGTGAITIASSGGQQFVLSVDPQSVQPETQTFIAGISASDTLYTSGNVRISGSNAVTVKSGTGQLVVIDVPVQSTQPETQTFIGGLSASDTLYTSGTVRITGVGGGVTVSSNTGQRIDISVAAQSVQPETQTFVSGIIASDTTYTSGNIRITGVGGGVTVSSNTGQRVDISVAAQSVQPETQTFVGAIVGSNATYTSGTVTFTGVGGGVTVSSNTGQRVDISVAAPVAQTNQAGSVYASSNTFGTSSGTYDARTLSIAGSGIVSVAASNSGWVISASQSANQNLSVGVSTGGNTAGNTTVNTGSRLVIVGSNGITASQGTAAGATTITLSGVTTAAQTNQTGNVYASSNTFGTSSGTYDARSLSIAGSGAVSVAASNSGWVVSAPAQSVQTQGILNVALSNVGNTSGDTGINSGTRMVLAGGNNITLSASTAANATTITISAPNLGAGAMSAGVSTGGNTAGATGITGTQLVLVGTNMISLSQTTGANGGTVSINATQSVQTQGVPLMGVSTGGATSGDTTVNSGTRFVLVGTNVTMSQGTAANATTVTVSAPATSSLSATGGIQISTNGSTISIGDGGQTAAYWENMPAMEGVLYTHISGVSKVPFYWPEFLPLGIKPANIALRVSQVTASADLSVSVHFGIYTFVNSTSAALLGSGSDAFVVSNGSSVSFSAQRNWVLTSPGTVAAISSLSAGNYLFGCMFSASATAQMNASIYAASAAAGPRVGRIMPGTNQLSTATSQGIAGLYGRGSTTVNAMPANVVASEVVNQGIAASSPMKPYIFIRS